jgi:4-hydroxybenzoyl-CoA thioesterase
MTDVDLTKPFSIQEQIRFTHTDPAGFVFFPRYFEMFQAVAEDWFTKRLNTKFSDMILVQQIGQPTAQIDCQFIKPCRLGEELDLAIVLEKFGTSSLELRFIGTVDGETRLRAHSVQVMVSMKTGRPVPISDKLRSELDAYKANVIPPADLIGEPR